MYYFEPENRKKYPVSSVEIGDLQPLVAPTQMFTHPSAPTMQAPSHESSASGGHTTPWTIAYACCFPTSGNNNGSVLVRKRETVCGRSISSVSRDRLTVSRVLTSVEDWGCEFLEHWAIRQIYPNRNAAHARSPVLIRTRCRGSRVDRRRTRV